MSSSHAAIPWPRIAAEGLVIVVSILLAFGLDAWWNNHQERGREDEILIGLEQEFIASLDDLMRTQQRHAARIHSATRLLEVVAAGPTEIQPDSLPHWFAWLARGTSFDPVRGTLDAVLGAGHLELIENDALRAAIAGWPARTSDYIRTEGHAMEVLLDDVWPYIRSRTALPRVGVFSEWPATQYAVDLDPLLADVEFENLLLEVAYWERSAHGDAEALVEETSQLLEAIRVRLNRN